MSEPAQKCLNCWLLFKWHILAVSPKREPRFPPKKFYNIDYLQGWTIFCQIKKITETKTGADDDADDTGSLSSHVAKWCFRADVKIEIEIRKKKIIS